MHAAGEMEPAPSLAPPEVLLHLTGRLLEVRSYSLRMHRIVVRCERELAYGTELRVVFLTPSGPLSIGGTVRWARHGEMGIYFAPPSPGTSAELARIIEAHGPPDRSGVVRATW